MRKKIAILGSTGSIGTQTIDVCKIHSDKFLVEALTTNKNVDILIEQILEFSPKYICIVDTDAYNLFMNEKIYNQELECIKKRIDNNDLFVFKGRDGLEKIAKISDYDIFLTAVVGMVGLTPTIEAIKRSKTIALANKETLVTAGEIVMKEAKKYNSKIVPVDSEHSAIFQCLNGEKNNRIDKILLTASGGPFRGMRKEELLNVTKAQALKHPNWTMGSKITIDSSTLMNKGLEVIEAKWLFDVDPDDIIVHIHPESIVHSMVQFKDSSVIAQMGEPDMRVPIQYALTYPERMESGFKRLNLFEIKSLNFEIPDMDVFPCLSIAYECLKKGGTSCSVLNAANEVLVEKFLKDEIGFYDIPKYIKEAVDNHLFIKNPDLEDIIEADEWARNFVEVMVSHKN